MLKWTVWLDFETKASPTQVRRALTDFSKRRLQTWHRTLDLKTYQVRDRGDTWAVAKESSSGSPLWVVCRFDWSDPDLLRWTITESSYGGGGQGWLRASPLGGGVAVSRAEWDNTGARWNAGAPAVLIHVGPMPWVLSRPWRSALDEYASQDTD